MPPPGNEHKKYVNYEVRTVLNAVISRPAVGSISVEDERTAGRAESDAINMDDIDVAAEEVRDVRFDSSGVDMGMAHRLVYAMYEIPPT